MKRCPECRRDYFDDSLVYCLDDGATLLEGPSSLGDADTAILAGTDPQSDVLTRRQLHDTDKTAILPAPKEKTSRATTLVVAGIVAIVGIVGLFGYRQFRAASTGQINSIAVLPFENQSGNADYEYLSDGMTESLMNSLSQLSNLSVKARSSVFRYKGKQFDPLAVGKELGVQAVLSGRVSQRGDQLSLSLDLADARTGDQIWGQQYTRKAGELAALQTEMARDVSQKLREKLTGEQQKSVTRNQTQDTEAYQLYLQGRFQWNKRRFDSNKKAIELFQQAIEKDPSYAMAYVGLAECYVTGFLSHRERKPKVEAAAAKALELDPTLGEPHAVLGIMRTSDFEYSAGEAEFKRAIELNPNYATAYHWYGEALAVQGRFDESFAQYKKALELDPLSLAIGTDLGITYYLARQPDRAIEHLRKLVDLDPNYVRTHFYLAIAYREKGKFDEAIDELTTALLLEGEDPKRIELAKNELHAAFKKGGAVGYWKKIVEFYELDLRSKVTIGPQDWARAYARAGMPDQAFQWIDKMFDEGAAAYAGFKVSPEWDPLRDDPRFADVLRRIRL